MLDCYYGGVSLDGTPGPRLSESSDELDSEEDAPISPESDNIAIPEGHILLHLLEESEFNWFQFGEQAEVQFKLNSDKPDNLFCKLPQIG